MQKAAETASGLKRWLVSTNIVLAPIAARATGCNVQCQGFCTRFVLTSTRGFEGRLGELFTLLSRDTSFVTLFSADGRLRMSDMGALMGEMDAFLSPGFRVGMLLSLEPPDSLLDT